MFSSTGGRESPLHSECRGEGYLIFRESDAHVVVEAMIEHVYRVPSQLGHTPGSHGSGAVPRGRDEGYGEDQEQEPGQRHPAPGPPAEPPGAQPNPGRGMETILRIGIGVEDGIRWVSGSRLGLRLRLRLRLRERITAAPGAVPNQWPMVHAGRGITWSRTCETTWRIGNDIRYACGLAPSRRQVCHRKPGIGFAVLDSPCHLSTANCKLNGHISRD